MEDNLALSQDNDDVADSYGKIAMNSDLRKATVSDTFNAKSTPTATTLILIIEAMGFKLADFASKYESIKESEIGNFNKGV